MEPERPDLPDMECKELVTLVNDYLDDALTPDERAEFDEHLEVCEGCQALLGQWRTTIELTGKLTRADLSDTDPRTRDRLTSALRRLRR